MFYHKRPPKLIISLLVGLASFLLLASPANAALFRLNPTSGEIANGSTIQVVLDTEGEEVESAVAIVTFDSSMVQISSTAAGGFFDATQFDSSTAGRVVITGTQNLGNIEGVTGSGVLATLTVSPQVASGTIVFSYSCGGGPGDSNIMASDGGYNLLTEAGACDRLVGGSYTIGTGGGDDDGGDSNDDGGGDSNDDGGGDSNDDGGGDSNDDGGDSNDGGGTSTDNNTGTTTTKGGQPVLPNELPQSGFEDLFKWFVTGLGLLGIGLLLL